MRLDLGALFSGVSRGLGSVTDIRLAEHLRQIASQEQFGQRQQLADEAFGRQKELLSLRDGMDQAGERSGIEGEFLRLLGAARAQDVPAMGAVPGDPSGLPTADLQQLIGQIEAAVSAVGSARQDREGAPKVAADAAKTRAQIASYEASAEANRALAQKRLTDSPDEDVPNPNKGRMTMLQWESRVEKRMMALMELESEEELAVALQSMANPQSVAVIRSAAEKQLMGTLHPSVIPLEIVLGQGTLPVEEQRPANALSSTTRPSLEDIERMSLVVPE